MTEEVSLVAIPGEAKKLDSREDVEHILKAIDECEGLTALKLSGNSFGVEAMEAIGEVLAQKPLLSKALWSDLFVSRLKTEIPPALESMGKGVTDAQAQLTELDLSDNAFGPAGVEAITTLLTSPSCFSLKVLKLNNNGLGSKGGSMLSKALLECHEEALKAGQKLTLEVFVCGRNRLEDVGARALSQVFKVLGSLVRVSMPQNGINPDGICSLAQAFSKNTNLEVIDLNDNTFTEVGAEAMAGVLPSLQKLKEVDFGDCLLRSEGAIALAHAIKDGSKLLETVRLSYGELDQNSGMVVVDSLANKDSIKSIDLNGNSFGEDGISLIKASLEAKGLIDALESLSEDEGLEDEDSDREEDKDSDDEEDKDSDDKEGKDSEEKEEIEKEKIEKENIEEDYKEEGKMTKDEEDKENDTSEVNTDRATKEETPSKQDLITVTIEEYMKLPSGENLVALGDHRAQLILDTLTRSTPTPTLTESDPSLPATEVAAMYVKVTSCYVDGCSDDVKAAVESTADVLLELLCQNGRVSELVNEILVQVGLIKSEDKKFQPVKEVEGPLLAFKHVARQQYFPKSYADILISFLTKPSKVLDSLTAKGTVHQVLQVLHTL